MIKPRHSAAALLAGALALAASGCGGGGKHSSSSTTASKPPATATTGTSTPAKTTTTKATPAPAKPKSNKPPLADTPAKTLTFSGSGVKDIGKPDPLRLPKNSTIEWTNDGAIFQIIPASVHVQSPVNSTAHSGTATIGKGAYYGFLINAVGHWTVKIIPSG